jgi:hypothetical protein
MTSGGGFLERIQCAVVRTIGEHQQYLSSDAPTRVSDGANDLGQKANVAGPTTGPATFFKSSGQ